MDALGLRVPMGPFCKTQCKSDRNCAASEENGCRLRQASHPKETHPLMIEA